MVLNLLIILRMYYRAWKETNTFYAPGFLFLLFWGLVMGPFYTVIAIFAYLVMRLS